jgi:uncharacterized membrane protein
MLFKKMKRKTKEKVYRAFVWVFLGVFVFTVAAAAIMMATAPANPPGH